MSPSPATSVPSIFHAGYPRTAALPGSSKAVRSSRSLRPGQRSILLSAGNVLGGSILLAFTRTRGGIAFWRSLSPERSPLEHVGTFPGSFSVRSVARLLASGAACPAVDAELIEDVWIDGVDEFGADVLKLAWCRVEGRIDPRASAVLSQTDQTLTRALEYADTADFAGLLDLGQRILDANRKWTELHSAGVDAEVDRRAAATGAGEQARREIRSFVEECLLTLGRLPRPDETAGAWDGAGVAGRDLGDRELRGLGLYQTGRSGKFHVWVRYWDGAGSIGRGDFGTGAGWYWDVTNPDPRWNVDGVMGPCGSAAEAWSNAACLADQE